tara:strand:+ start:448 stop:999 length:552 start_codon:yes stop_codon:yes gene_type:complete
MILVDTPRWPWRDQLWGHMVSDVSLQELHQFARQIGKRRIGFQGDHYDVNQKEHQLAIEAGAKAVGSRELVRSLRDSGLRNRTNRPTWSVVYESTGSQTQSELVEAINRSISSEDHRTRLHHALLSANPHLEALSALIVEHEEASAVVLKLREDPCLDSVDLDLFVNSESDGLRVVELIIGDC